MKSRVLAVAIPLLLMFCSLLIPAAAGYTPHQGDTFNYYEEENLRTGTGYYEGYSEQTIIKGMEQVNGVSGDGTVSAHYGYSWDWSNSTGNTETGNISGDYTFSSTTLLYVKGTDDQIGYVNPTVWFAMNSSIPNGGTFYLLNTQMTVMSTNYNYNIPAQNKNVLAIFAEGSSSYLRDDLYGRFTATYTWDAYFDPSSGYIVGYYYVENDADSSGNGFTYTDNLYVTSSSYPLTVTTTTPTTQNTSTETSTPVSSDFMQYAGYIGGVVFVAMLIAVLSYALSRRGGGRTTLPKHSYQEPPPPSPIHLAPPYQPPVQQIVIKEVVKVKCRYCGALIESTAQNCYHCGAPRT